MGMGFAPTWLRQVSPLASHDHFNHWLFLFFGFKSGTTWVVQKWGSCSTYMYMALPLLLSFATVWRLAVLLLLVPLQNVTPWTYSAFCWIFNSICDLSCKKVVHIFAPAPWNPEKVTFQNVGPLNPAVIPRACHISRCHVPDPRPAW